jgi:hypothetical protein
MKRNSNPNRRLLQRVAYLPIPWNDRGSRGEQVSYHINLSCQSPFCLILKPSFWARSSVNYLPLISYCRAPLNPNKLNITGMMGIDDIILDRIAFGRVKELEETYQS